MAGKKRILLIEDNPDDRELMMIALQENRLVNEVLVARDGEEAIEILKTDENFALILLDLQLPKVDGHEVLRFIRSRTRLVPVVVLTSSDEDRDIVESYDLGANSYVRKPVAFDDFLEATRQLGMYWLLLNEGPPERGSS
ncbi:MAG TPA: response regulator [Thermoanaerobaculia bacterium]|nr:response regulator [Thermoanaerobaculia bacterium]